MVSRRRCHREHARRLGFQTARQVQSNHPGMWRLRLLVGQRVWWFGGPGIWGLIDRCMRAGYGGQRGLQPPG